MNIRRLLLLIILLVPILVVAQTNRQTSKEITKLLCPFEQGMGREPKEAYYWDPPDKKIVMVSQKDTIIRCGIDAKVLTVSPTEDGTYEIVVHYGDYYLWYYGVTKSMVTKGQSVKAGQAIAKYTRGKEMEFRLYKDEEAIDPRPWLDCKASEN